MSFGGMHTGGKSNGAAHQATTGKMPRESKPKRAEKKVAKAPTKEHHPKIVERIANKLIKKTKTAERKAKLAAEKDTTPKLGGKWKKGDKEKVRGRGKFFDQE